MATQTTNLGLTKPDEAEGYDVNVFNNNADIVDGAVGALLNNSGGVGEKVDALLDNVAAVKTDTEALIQALNTANQNIATLLTQTKGVKAIFSGHVAVPLLDGVTIDIPATMNPERIVIITTAKGVTSTAGGFIDWVREGQKVTFYTNNSNITMSYQFVEFY